MVAGWFSCPSMLPELPLCWFVFLLLPHDHEAAAAAPDIALMLHSEEQQARGPRLVLHLSRRGESFSRNPAQQVSAFSWAALCRSPPPAGRGEESVHMNDRPPATVHPKASSPASSHSHLASGTLQATSVQPEAHRLSPVDRQVGDLADPCRAWDLSLTSIADTCDL